MAIPRYPSSPTSPNKLWERVQDFWEDLPEEFLSNLYKSMLGNIAEVFKQKRGNIGCFKHKIN